MRSTAKDVVVTLEPHYQDDAVTLYHGDCVEVMAAMEPDSVDAVVCDPPYGLGFMGKEWDRPGQSFFEPKPAKANKFDHVGGNHNPSNSADASRTRRVESQRFGAWSETWAVEALRVLKPGGHLLAFGGTRTYHRMTVAIEDAGFEVRDCIAWMYGSGFPKSMNVAKSIEGTLTTGNAQKNGFHKLAGEATGSGRIGMYDTVEAQGFRKKQPEQHGSRTLDASTDEARQWEGWGTALKPAHEPIVVARKPLIGTVAANVLEHGTGALNIDGCRVGSGGGARRSPEDTHARGKANAVLGKGLDLANAAPRVPGLGRWPANVVLDEEAATLLDRQSGTLTSGSAAAGGHRRNGDKHRNTYSPFAGQEVEGDVLYGDSGGASRFFYCAKASKADRGATNSHPTVKPLELMRWLVRLVTPSGGTVLDPFAGSGTTAEACIIEGFRSIVIEAHEPYLPIIVDRITKPIQPDMFGGDAA